MKERKKIGKKTWKKEHPALQNSPDKPLASF